MAVNSGISIKGVKQKNQSLILKLIATHPGMSRIDLAKATHLTKMTVSNIVSDLIAHNIIQEDETFCSAPQPSNGRTPTPLKLSSKAPKAIGVLIKRGLLQIILGDLAGNVLDSITVRPSTPLDAPELLSIILNGIDTLRSRNSVQLLGIGISSIGPLDVQRGMILNPPNFYDIHDYPIVDAVHQHTQLPTFLINDGNAGALSEKMYGIGKSIPNFLYVYIKHGIGSGLVLHGELYNGDRGQSGELGHSTINFAGPQCPCGNIGCLEMYANITNVRNFIRQQLSLYPDSHIQDPSVLSLVDIIDLANQNDSLAVSALNEYCNYLSHGILNVLNTLDISCVIMDYESNTPGTILEDLILRKIQPRIGPERFHSLQILRSQFRGHAPLIGSLALIADNVFHETLDIFA